MFEYRTKDLNMAAYVWTLEGVDFINVVPEMSKGRQKVDAFYFTFNLPFADQRLTEILRDHANGKASVEPQLFVQKQNNLRDVLYRVKKKPIRSA